ncbi:MAG: hypothetical protein A3H98_03935 [Bacteroidetes bacterium RIFCSPLOWO2_02_FULL_36_8]|nr:MAG: hypothetical protein A3H98_03935 [Bacteroidetes bacterium RIFCSPLOWO2_02_FULL_36_8]
MNPWFFISNRIGRKSDKTFSRTILTIATWGLSIGLAVMIIATSVLFGFQQKIKDKIFTFTSHLTIKKFSNNESYEEPPFSINYLSQKSHFNKKSIANIQPYIYKTSLMKTNEGVLGVIIKGVDKNFKKNSWKEYMMSGTIPDFGDSLSERDVMISKKIADKLKIKSKDECLLYFAQNPPKYRKVKVSGIFESGMEVFDDFMIIGGRRLINSVNGTSQDNIGGIEIWLKDERKIGSVYEELSSHLPYDLQILTVYDLFGHLFDWLKLLDRNVIIIITLVLWVAGFNLISALLFLILEKMKMIAILKTIGATNRQIMKLFLYLGAGIITKGLIWGNLIGIGVSLIQYYFKVIPLQPENYYMNHVPVLLNVPVIILLNAGTLLLTLLMLVIPGYIASQFKPVTILKSD